MVKNVPLRLLARVEGERDFHEDDFVSVKATVEKSHELRDFEFYFQHTLDLVDKLEAFWNE